MSSKFLDKTGLDTLWAKIKSTFQTLGNLVTAWGSTPSDTKYPSEKLVKDSLDTIPFNADFQFMTQTGTSDKCCIVKFSKPVNAYNGSNNTTVGLYVLDAYNYRSSAGPEYQSKVQLMIKITDGASTNSSVVAIDGLSGKFLPLSGFSLHVKTAVNNVVDIYLVYTTNTYLVTCVGKFSRLWDVNYFTETWYKSSTSFTPFNASGDNVSKSVITDNILTKLTGFVGGTLSFTDGKPVIDTSALGTLDVEHGGTGGTTQKAAEYNVCNPDEVSVTPGDNSYVVFARTDTASTTNGRFQKLKLSYVWNHIKGKISSVLGLTETSYGGNAATATTAAGYTSGGAIDTALDGKVDKETGKGLSTNDFTDTYKSNVDSNTSARHTHSNKSVLDGISSTDVNNWNAAEPNVQSDWNQTTTTADDYIKNKPQNLVQDASYVHTDNNYTTADKDKVASAVQPGDLATVATSGSYTDLSNRPYSDDFGYFSSGSSSSNLWGQVAKVKWLSSLDGSSTVRGTLLMHQYSSNIVTAEFEIMFETAGSIGYARLFGCFTGSFFTKVKLAVAISSVNKELVFYGYLGGIPYSGISVTVQSVKRYSGNTISDFTVTYSKGSSSVSTEPSGLTYCENVLSNSVRAVTSIDTSTMDPDVLYVM